MQAVVNASTNRITIRGRTLDLDALHDPRIGNPAFRQTLRQQFESASPFPHLVLDGVFDAGLLALVREEFDLHTARDWRSFNGAQEDTFRSPLGAQLGPASKLYFNLVNSHEFVEFLESITGVEHLIVDRTLFGGGLHESRNGGKFGIHRDFDRHAETGLRNEMVFLTYLNPGWDMEWGGALELWDAREHRPVVSVPPEFGTSLLMRNRHDSYHGHPDPMELPKGVQRRSLASYYYTNSHRQEHRALAQTTRFLRQSQGHALRHWALRAARQWAPPVMWDVLRGLRRRVAT